MGATIALLSDQDHEGCRRSCLLNPKCESFNSKDFGNGCELNNKVKSENETQLIAREGWSYRGTKRNEILVSSLCITFTLFWIGPKLKITYVGEGKGIRSSRP